MTKTSTTKNAEMLAQLNALIKAAGAPKPTATGIPGKEPESAAVSAKHDSVDQNAVKPENNNPQAHSQKPSSDPAKPTGGKKAEETPADTANKEADDKGTRVQPSGAVEKLGSEILALLQKFAENPTATGIPGKEPESAAISTKHDTVNQNAVKPENNNPQAHGQKPATDPSTPVASAKSAEADKVAADKAASFELGKLWAELALKQANEQRHEQIKQAGRRDFELLVRQAQEQMKSASPKATEKVAAELDKQAEAEGAAYFQELFKQAQVEQSVRQILEQNAALEAKLAAFETTLATREAALKAEIAEKQAALDRKLAEERENEKFAGLAAMLRNDIMDALRKELVSGR